ncbi:MAG: hypothetical protein ALECFALPRED_010404 [Alectoria fallacina]|uniref:Uncharacterized protein n=1 Tax=Alectoria fallacina TaxID=1903189 RepID=A0A8H3IHL3_9LECA|nr:MAG: hypothetical protein ALECFALPRED_010404 [Alectoria fallacina]
MHKKIDVTIISAWKLGNQTGSGPCGPDDEIRITGPLEPRSSSPSFIDRTEDPDDRHQERVAKNAARDGKEAAAIVEHEARKDKEIEYEAGFRYGTYWADLTCTHDPVLDQFFGFPPLPFHGFRW